MNNDTSQGSRLSTVVRYLCGGLGALASTAPFAQEVTTPAPSRSRVQIPSGDLRTALRTLEDISKISISADPALIADKQTRGIAAEATTEEALRRVLTGTGLSFRRLSDRAFVVVKADESSDADPRDLDTVFVEGTRDDEQTSATKSRVALRETPQAISVVTRESIEERQARDLTSALELTAGLTSGIAADGGPFAGRGLGGGEGFLLRGQELDGKRDVRMDGFVVSSNIFDLAAFERIEVVKGPSSTLYGQGSLGGFINMIRKKPQLERIMSVAAQAGSFDTYRGEADITGAFDESGRYIGRLSVAYDDSGSFIDHVDTRTMLAAPSFEMMLDEKTRALVQFLYQHDEYTPSRGIPLRQDGDEAKIPEVSRHLFAGVPSQEESSATNRLTTLQLDRHLNDDWFTSLHLQKSSQSRERFFDSYSNNGALDTSGDVYIYSDTSTTDDDNWAGELRLDGRVSAFGRDHRVLVGYEQGRRRGDLAFGYTALGIGNIYTEDFREENVLPGGARNQNFDFDLSTINRDRALYAQSLISVLDRTKLLLGVRYDESDIWRQNNNTLQIDTKSDSEITLRLGLTHDVSSSLTAYANYAQSFNPTVDARSESGRILDPETGEGYEVGMKGEWFEGLLSATTAVFRQELDNRPITDPNDHHFSINGGLQRTDGIELELSGSPLPGLKLGVAASWLDSEYIDRRDENFGLAPFGLIRQQATFYTGYVLQQGPLRGFGLGATVVQVGERILSGAEYMPGHERVDLHFSYDAFSAVEVSLQIRNVFDERYIERLRDRWQDNFFGAPRAVLLRVEYAAGF
jgi:TonB-dependent siderophore receptor